MPYEIGLDLVDRHRLLGEWGQLRLCCLTVVQPELVARLQVEGDRRVGVRLQVRREGKESGKSQVR